jgi:hypothetical protein
VLPPPTTALAAPATQAAASSASPSEPPKDDGLDPLLVQGKEKFGVKWQNSPLFPLSRESLNLFAVAAQFPEC